MKLVFCVIASMIFCLQMCSGQREVKRVDKNLKNGGRQIELDKDNEPRNEEKTGNRRHKKYGRQFEDLLASFKKNIKNVTKTDRFVARRQQITGGSELCGEITYIDTGEIRTFSVNEINNGKMSNCNMAFVGPENYNLFVMCVVLLSKDKCRYLDIIAATEHDVVKMCPNSITSYVTNGNDVFFQVIIRKAKELKKGHATCSITSYQETKVPPPKPTCECGESSLISSRIIGGAEAMPHTFPWQVYLISMFPDYGAVSCGSTLISDRFVITAAYCVLLRTGGKLTMASYVDLFLGAQNKVEYEYEQMQTVDKLGIIPHEHYDDSIPHNDIALIKLNEKIIFTDTIKPICMPSASNPDPDQVIAAGWGDIDHGYQPSDVLMMVILDVISNEKCKELYDEHGKIEITDDMMCTFTKDKDTCNGDGGGGIIGLDIFNNKWMIYGIVNYGIGCGSAFPGVYTRVQSYLDWINHHTDNGVCEI